MVCLLSRAGGAAFLPPGEKTYTPSLRPPLKNLLFALRSLRRTGPFRLALPLLRQQQQQQQHTELINVDPPQIEPQSAKVIPDEHSKNAPAPPTRTRADKGTAIGELTTISNAIRMSTIVIQYQTSEPQIPTNGYSNHLYFWPIIL